jgi:4-hydroxy-2-oxoheptanedioate aldolase
MAKKVLTSFYHAAALATHPLPAWDRAMPPMPARTEPSNTLRPSRLLKLLRAGETGSVLKLNLSDPRLVEIAGLCGVDAIWICNEHVPNDWLSMENQIRAAKLHDMDTLVRVARGSYSDYVRALEADATGIIVPHVADAREARQVVEWARFQPIGKRAFDGGNSDGRYCLVPTAAYIRHSNTERIIILQIESPEALEEVEKIAAVPGFNGLMFGPGDFSHRIGRAGEVGAPPVVAARKRVAAAARRNGKFAMASGFIAPIPELLAEGHEILGVGADVIGFSSYIKGQLRQLRDELVQAAAPRKATSRPKSG